MEAIEFAQKCKAAGITIERAEGSILTLSKAFTAHDNAGFAAAETDVSILYEAPGKGGSVWGTDGASIGGMVALRTGIMRLNKSGVQKRWLAALKAVL